MLTSRSKDMCYRHVVESGDEVDSLIEDSAEESLADASGYERIAGFRTDALGCDCVTGAML